MVDAHALGACGLGRAGSNPASPTRGLRMQGLFVGGVPPDPTVHGLCHRSNLVRISDRANPLRT